MLKISGWRYVKFEITLLHSNTRFFHRSNFNVDRTMLLINNNESGDLLEFKQKQKVS